jgi:membrane peptidoglycan carboxypeptidase
VAPEPEPSPPETEQETEAEQATRKVGQPAQESEPDPDEDEPPATPRRSRRRLIDYPRRGRTGVRRWIPSWKLTLGVALLLLGAILAAGGIALAVVKVPQPNEFATRQATSFQYADGRSEIAHVGVNRDSVPIDRIPPTVRQAVLAAEDRQFYTESGISPTGILRALKNNLTGGNGNPQGGSTITQQYVKNYYLTRQQTLSRKVKEALISIKTDQIESKDTILQNYLNTIYFGRNSYGIEAASVAYFGVPVAALEGDPARAAYLAALIQSPYYYSTADSDPDAARRLEQRWNYVLDGMVQQHQLATADRARLAFPRPVPPRSNDLAGMNGYMVNTAMQYLDRLHQQDPDVPDSSVVSRGGYTVVTTFRPDHMAAAQQAVALNLSTLDPEGNPNDRDVHVGLAAVDQATGAILGFYGGPDYVRQGFNDATQAAGPLGSNLAEYLTQYTRGRSEATPSPRARAAGFDTDTLDKLGFRAIGPSRGGRTSGDGVTATPVSAAAAFSLTRPRRQYHQPYAVSRVIQDGQVIWQAEPDADRLSEDSSNITTGTDPAAQWAWSFGSDSRVSVAVDMYATAPGSQRNRKLAGMTRTTSTLATPSVADETTSAAQFNTVQIVREFLRRTDAGS